MPSRRPHSRRSSGTPVGAPHRKRVFLAVHEAFLRHPITASAGSPAPVMGRKLERRKDLRGWVGYGLGSGVGMCGYVTAPRIGNDIVRRSYKKFAITLAALAASAFAQRIQIGAPKNFAEVKAGSNITVEVDRPNSLTGSTEVGIAIGLWPCGGPKGTSKCASTDVSQVLGNVVYTGSFKPEYDSTDPTKPPHQNFEVTVPSSFSPGQVSLGVAHLSLVGAGSGPFYEFTNITLVVS